MSSKPILRDHVKVQLHRLIADALVGAGGAQRSCINCTFFRETSGELCSLYNQRPPARIIALGCAQYSDVDDIPF